MTPYLLLGIGLALVSCSGPSLIVEDIASPGGSGSRYPNLWATGEQTLLTSWLEPGTGDTFSLRMAEWDGDRWQPPHTVASGANFFVNWADFPSLYQSRGDTLAAHWLVRSAGGTYEYDTHVSMSPDRGETWSVPMKPHRDNRLTEHGFVSFFPFPSADAGLVWLDGRNMVLPGGPEKEDSLRGSMFLYAATLEYGGKLGPEVVLDNRVCECCATSSAAAGSTVVVAYRDRSKDEVRDIQVVRYVSGSWSEPGKVHEDRWTLPGCPVNGPAVAIQDGRVAVAWFTAPDGAGRVNVAFSPDTGRTFLDPIRLDDGNPLGRVDSEWLPEGDLLVSWIELVDEAALVMIRRISPSGTRGPTIPVGSIRSGRESGFPRMARLGNTVYLAWTSPDVESGLVIKRIGPGRSDGSS
ncbi:MAG: sialidase family protein [Fidelibacterota bacterium]